MEVAAILASAQAATQLAGTCYEIGTFLYGIRTTYKESSSTMRSIETECRIFQASVAHIQEWLQAQTQTSSSVTQIESVGSALGLINDSMKDMRKTLSKVTASRGTPMADRWVKAKFMMYEDALKAHLAELREHARLVQFTITTLQLYARHSRGTEDCGKANVETGKYLGTSLLHDPLILSPCSKSPPKQRPFGALIRSNCKSRETSMAEGLQSTNHLHPKTKLIQRTIPLANPLLPTTQAGRINHQGVILHNIYRHGQRKATFSSRTKLLFHQRWSVDLVPSRISGRWAALHKRTCTSSRGVFSFIVARCQIITYFEASGADYCPEYYYNSLPVFYKCIADADMVQDARFSEA